MFGFLKKIFGNKQERDIEELRPVVAQINEEYAKLKSLSHDELRHKTIEFRAAIKDYLADIDVEIEKLQEQAVSTEDIFQKEDLYKEVDQLKKDRDQRLEEVLQNLLPQAFAVVKETARRFTEEETLEVTATDFDHEVVGNWINDEIRPLELNGDKAIWKNRWMAAGNEVVWNMIHYDVQLIGGAVLHSGKIAEMATGEGKTLVATLPAYLNGLAGEGVHIITVNDYLAKRDAEWMAPLLSFLFLTVDCIDKHRPHSDGRKAAYRCDVTYGTNNEFGFDYLRDNMVHKVDEKVQGKFHYTMIDEVDSVLIDDARTPLIISGPTPKDDRAELFLGLKPAVEHIMNAQKKLVVQLIRSAKQKIAAGDTGPEEGGGGLDLFRAYRGLPKNRALIKFLSEPGMQQILQKTEAHYMAEQSKHMHKADAELFFVIEEKNRSVELTDRGTDLLGKGGSDKHLFVMEDINDKLLQVDNNSSLNPEEKQLKKDELIQAFAAKSERLHAMRQLLKAYALFHKEDEYIVVEGKVKIVDEQTGRVMDGRRYSDGLHQALEAKENVEIENSTQTYATVTLQNFFRMYHKLAGMTGTAETESQELWDIYKLDVVIIPTNRPIARDDRNDLVYKTEREKYNAIIEEVIKMREAGRPILVGTTSVQSSEVLSRMLSLRKIPHNVLNAKQHAREADVVAEAGKSGQVTIATNMAGRGTDIKLTDEVKQLGGLAIIGTERHDSRRVDRQLRGRAGRQGDVGSSQFYVSLEDKLMRLFRSDRIAKMMDRLGHKEGDVLQHPMISKSIERAQKKVEENNFGIRKRLLEYDDVMNMQREEIYRRRNNALEGDRLAIDLNDMFLDLLYELIAQYQNERNYEGFEQAMIQNFGIDPQITAEELYTTDPNDLTDQLSAPLFAAYNRKFEHIAQAILPLIQRIYEDESNNFTKIAIPFTNGIQALEINADMEQAVKTNGKSLINQIERSITLALIDSNWKEHLRDMDELKDQVQNASFAQKDPLVIYKIESRKLFAQLRSQINQEVCSFLFRGLIPIQQESQIQEAQEVEEEEYFEEVHSNIEEQKAEQEAQRQAAQQEQAPIEKVAPRRVENKIGRNDPCPCGSGKKYKQCHGKN